VIAWVIGLKAKRADREIAAGNYKRKFFMGIPMAVKDDGFVKGYGLLGIKPYEKSSK